MLGARDAYLAADVMVFGGANQTQLWHAFASRGMGQTASTTSSDDDNPIPGWSSPKENNGRLTVTAVDENGAAVKAKVFVGDFEARITPSADTDSATPLSNSFAIVPGKYDLIANAPGYGHLRFKTTIQAGKTSTVTLHFYTNWASSTKGATASGDGGNFADLIDDTEGTDWAYIGSDSVKGKHVDVKLGSPRKIDIVQVSAMLHQAADDDDYDNVGQNRFTALKSFEIWGCLGSSANSQCGGSTGWTKYKTVINGFPAGLPRPLMPDMLIKQWEVDTPMIDHLRLVVVDNQCTGTAAYHGELDNDPSNATDCVSASDKDSTVRIAELQAMVEEPYATGGYLTSTQPDVKSAGVNTTTVSTTPSASGLSDTSDALDSTAAQ
jgi:extracellular elastinolytic metalloproteinase